jgi:hypothetical protein
MTFACQIVKEFGLPEEEKHSVVQRAQVIDWMRSADLEGLGALFAFITKPEYAARIAPPLTIDDFWDFLSRYLGECFRQDAEGEWAHGRYPAGWDLAKWMRTIWNDAQFTDAGRRKIKSWLADLYLSADKSLRRALVDAVLEHAFEERRIAEFFSDWAQHPTLSVAYHEAADGSRGP